MRIDRITRDIIYTSLDSDRITMSDGIGEMVGKFHEFLYENVYRNPKAKGEESKVHGILSGIFEYYEKRPDLLPSEYRKSAEREGIRRGVCDYVSGMTDKYAMYQFGQIFLPNAWQVR